MDQQLATSPDEPLVSSAGKDLLIGQIAKITNNVENIVVERIDSLINRLQNLKQMAIIENKASLDKFASFIEAIDEGLQDTKKLEELVSKLEKSP